MYSIAFRVVSLAVLCFCSSNPWQQHVANAVKTVVWRWQMMSGQSGSGVKSSRRTQHTQHSRHAAWLCTLWHWHQDDAKNEHDLFS